jgi:hypothetical protein
MDLPSKRCSPHSFGAGHGWLWTWTILFAALLGGFASGLAGFAIGFIVSGFWLHLITPAQTAGLMSATACGPRATASGSCAGRWIGARSRRSSSVAPLAFRSARCCCAIFGAAYLRLIVGVLLLIYTVYAREVELYAPKSDQATAGAISFFNGILPRSAGGASRPLVRVQMHGKLDDATFRKLVLILLVCSGLALIGAQGRQPLTHFNFWPVRSPKRAGPSPRR